MNFLRMHRECLSDERGQRCFESALGRAVRRDDVVLDLGTGTGIHAVMACRAGARRVYAVDCSPALLEVARTVVRSCGYQDKVTFIEGFSSDIALPAGVDLIVAHLGFSGHLRYLTDACTRFLKEHGKVLPAAADLNMVPVEVPLFYEQNVEFWSRVHHGIDFASVHRTAVNQAYEIGLSPETFLAEPAGPVRLEFRQVDPVRAECEAVFTIQRAGVLSGVGFWVDVLFDEVTRYSTDPRLGPPSPPWSHTFFPLEKPVAVREGDQVSARLKAVSHQASERIWKWVVRVRTAAAETTFSHSTFEGMPLAPELFGGRGGEETPPLTPRLEAARTAMALLDGTRSPRAIADALLERHPQVFQDRGEAEMFVRRLIRGCGP